MEIQQIQDQLIGPFHLRIMTQIKIPALKFLQFQVGELIERPSAIAKPPGSQKPTDWLFHLLGYGSTREAALAMAGMSSTTTLIEELH